MMKSLLPALILVAGLSSPALCQQALQWQSMGAQGDPGTTNAPTSDVTMTENNTNGNYYVQPPSNTSTSATSQSLYQGITNGVPTTSGMPIPGTYIAPGNIAGMVWGGPVLPITNLDSFVAQSGYNFDIYGDEGTQGPPPLGDFSTINSGISDNLTTGHASALPSAWGWPN